MPRSIRELQAQYITDAAGNKTAVILPLEEYEELLEDLQDLAALAERRDEPTISHEEVVARLKRDGYLQD
jgi:PHD/YefM family antitoxin component YafN of YafNO toxin-antitoxin module